MKRNFLKISDLPPWHTARRVEDELINETKESMDTQNQDGTSESVLDLESMVEDLTQCDDLNEDVAEMPGPLLLTEALDLLNALGELLEELSLRSVSQKRSSSTACHHVELPTPPQSPTLEHTMPLHLGTQL